MLQGSFTDTGVYGFGDQRVNPGGGVDADSRFGLRICITLLRPALLPSSSGKQSPLLPISPCVIEYLSCI